MKPNAPFGVTLNPTHPGLLETEPNANQHTLRWAEVEVVLWWDGDGEDEFEVASRGDDADGVRMVSAGGGRKSPERRWKLRVRRVCVLRLKVV
ncbi:hypothetical protein Tco_1466687 [Tanacetum coccineum]